MEEIPVRFIISRRGQDGRQEGITDYEETSSSSSGEPVTFQVQSFRGSDSQASHFAAKWAKEAFNNLNGRD